MNEHYHINKWQQTGQKWIVSCPNFFSVACVVMPLPSCSCIICIMVNSALLALQQWLAHSMCGTDISHLADCILCSVVVILKTCFFQTSPLFNNLRRRILYVASISFAFTVAQFWYWKNIQIAKWSWLAALLTNIFQHTYQFKLFSWNAWPSSFRRLAFCDGNY